MTSYLKVKGYKFKVDKLKTKSNFVFEKSDELMQAVEDYLTENGSLILTTSMPTLLSRFVQNHLLCPNSNIFIRFKNYVPNRSVDTKIVRSNFMM